MGRAAKDVDDWAAAWFTLKGVVVSGRQIPVGVLSTYMYPAGQAPLELVVHFSKAYPPEVCPFRAVSRSQQHLIFNPRHMYFNSFKEALSILTGMSALPQILLWDTLPSYLNRIIFECQRRKSDPVAFLCFWVACPTSRPNQMLYRTF